MVIIEPEEMSFFLQGHENEALNLMSSYLPKDSTGSPYAEGGGLYALGGCGQQHSRLCYSMLFDWLLDIVL